MDSLVPAQITSELTQILSNLILGDNAIRSAAEKAVDERLAQTPDVYVTALAETAVGNEKEVMRSFALVLLRRLLFRSRGHVPVQQHQQIGGGGQTNSTQAAVRAHHMAEMALYDHLSLQTLQTLERLLLHSLTHERSYSVRMKCVDTICDVSNEAMKRGRPWHDLQVLGFQMSQQANGDQDWQLRESAFKVFAGSPNLVMDLQSDAVVSLFGKGLGDSHIEVRLAALQASVAYLTSADPTQLAAAAVLMSPILQTLPAAASSTNPLSTPSATSPPPSALNTPNYASAPTLATFITSLTPLATSHPTLFGPHLPALVSFLPGLVLPPLPDEGVTPTVARPLGAAKTPATRPHRSMTFPPLTQPTTAPLPSAPPGGRHGLNLNTSFTANNTHSHDDNDTEAAKELRQIALEFMLSLSEAKPSMVKRVDGWVGIVVRACLEGMGEFDEDETGSELREWLGEDPTVSSSDSDTTAALYEQSLDRLACALGGKAILPQAFQYIPSMLASYDWRSRHAGLLAIAAIAEGTGKVMQKELGKVVDLVTPLFKDSHPRVRYAACQCVGQLCTDLEETIQESYHQQLFSGLIPTLEDPEPRVHANAASALINFCEGVERDTLLPYLDMIVERLLRLLRPPAEEGKPPKLVKKFVQEQVVTTLAMVADASEASFAKYYSTIMPLLLNVLQNAEGAEYKRLRIKAMECAGLIAIAVGRDVFRPDANTFAESLIRLQKTPTDASDPQLLHYLMATWAKLCQAMGPEFEPYLPFVMPNLLTSASAKADVTVYDEEPTAETPAPEGWETINMDGHLVGVRTSGIEEKCQAFETMVIYASTLGAKYAPYLSQSLEVALPQLCFHFHDGVREACAMLIPMLLSSGKQSNTLTQEMVAATLVQLIRCIADEHDPSFLSSMIKSFSDSLVVITGSSSPEGGPHIISRETPVDWRLPAEYHNGILEASKRQLQSIAERRRIRAAIHPQNRDEEDKEDLALYEEMEEFALEEMARLVRVLDAHTQAQLQLLLQQQAQGQAQGGQGVGEQQLRQWHERQQQMQIAISSVKDLGISRFDESDDDVGV